MATKTFNVLRVNSVEETDRCRSAIARVILNIQQEYGLTHQQIAEAIDVSLGTISNAANKKADLSSIYRDRLGQVFGGHVLNPIAARFGSQIVPLKAAERDALPSLSASVHRLAVAQSPESPGGVAVTHGELLAMLPDLRVAVEAINSLIVRAERIAA